MIVKRLQNTHEKAKLEWCTWYVTRSKLFQERNASIQKKPSIGGFRKSVLNTCNKFTGEHACRSVILIKLLCNFIEMEFRHGCSAVNLWHIFRTPFHKNTYEELLLKHSIAFEFDRIKPITPPVAASEIFVFFSDYIWWCHQYPHRILDQYLDIQLPPLRHSMQVDVS